MVLCITDAEVSSYMAEPSVWAL